jgi:hypothetical protein
MLDPRLATARRRRFFDDGLRRGCFLHLWLRLRGLLPPGALAPEVKAGAGSKDDGYCNPENRALEERSFLTGSRKTFGSVVRHAREVGSLGKRGHAQPRLL